MLLEGLNSYVWSWYYHIINRVHKLQLKYIKEAVMTQPQFNLNQVAIVKEMFFKMLINF